MKQGWEIKKLGDVCTIERGGSPRPIDAYITDKDNGINWIKIGDATPNSKYITSTKEKIKPEGIRKSRMVYKGDFILSNSMSFGRPYILGVDGCIHDGWLVLRDNENTFDKIFLYYYLSSPFIYQEFKRLAVGGVVNNLNSELVRGVNVIVPPIAEQEKIVAELDCLSGIIEKKKQQLKELDNLAQSIFYEMFGDPVENDKGWEKKRLDEIGKVITGNTPSTKDESNYSSADYCFVKPSDIAKDSISYISNTEFYVSEKAYINSRQLPKGSVLTTCIGIIGKVGILQKDATCNQQINAIIPNKDIDAKFLAHVLFMIRDVLTDVANAPIVPIINKKEFSSVSIPVPLFSLQQDFASKIESIEKQKELIAKAIKETETLFNSRMDYYFN